jgi:hypothetical protein
MLALSYAPHNTSSAWEDDHAERMPASQPMHAMCMGMTAAATSANSTIISGTDVLASVFLFVVRSLLLGLVTLLSLLLIGLTGLISLESLVGHSVVRTGTPRTHRTQGD